ncbi:RluA family pseudouridine synthase [Sphingopyxis flava]|uniref:tRNA pseudouridine32 synthase / 23S rRNA pseudouridine746 synthase n=1 Tax=Sphingopyxis flava TaxID=1507287 RepID=A0A1T5CHZ7_9SPHN|nr:RNA pseudouridine synthase [Sphingopyxis flava]SKB59115.1 tRNA pseudouridine32 synthase / 23S rRNA pseudouridine746 synthase [Sphingopyxis flava]
MLLSDRILFLDGEAIVLDKPAGLPVDPPRDGSLSLENHLDSLRFGFKRWPLAVHRLDRDTSGCLLLARNPKAHGRFTRAFEERAVDKQYLAILDGVPESDGGTIDLPLAKISSAEAGWRMVGDPHGTQRGKAAVSHWEKLATVEGRSLLRFRPETGRTHQLRVHALEGLGFPLVGDPVYGLGNSATRTLLHAERLVVKRDPKPPIIAEAPFPDAFVALGFTEPAGAAPTRG